MAKVTYMFHLIKRRFSLKLIFFRLSVTKFCVEQMVQGHILDNGIVTMRSGHPQMGAGVSQKWTNVDTLRWGVKIYTENVDVFCGWPVMYCRKELLRIVLCAASLKRWFHV